jgi:hypothetical protein
VQDGAVLRDVDLFTPEHGVDPRLQIGLLGQSQEQLEGLVVGNPVSVRLFENEIRCRFVFSGKNDELTPDFFSALLMCFFARARARFITNLQKIPAFSG